MKYCSCTGIDGNWSKRVHSILSLTQVPAEIEFNHLFRFNVCRECEREHSTSPVTSNVNSTAASLLSFVFSSEGYPMGRPHE